MRVDIFRFLRAIVSLVRLVVGTLALLQLALGAADLAKRGWSYIAARIGLGRGPAAKVTIDALLWDLTDMNTEAIVNSAATDLRMDRGLAGAIKRAAGEVVEREAMAQAPVLQGTAVATSAGELGDPINWVIHAVSIGPHHEISESMVRAATASALALAADMGIRSIAFPAMCTDAGELRLWGVAEAMVGEAKLMALKATSLERIEFALDSQGALAVFQDVLSR